MTTERIMLFNMSQPSSQFELQLHQFNAQRNIIISKCWLFRRSGMNIFPLGEKSSGWRETITTRVFKKKELIESIKFLAKKLLAIPLPIFFLRSIDNPSTETKKYRRKNISNNRYFELITLHKRTWPCSYFTFNLLIINNCIKYKIKSN